MKHHTITKKQLYILTLLYRFRFLNRYHIQHFLNHKDQAPTNRLLTDLLQKNYIHRIYSTSLKENTQPAIYYLSSKTIDVLKQNQPEANLRFIYREKDRSEDFKELSLFTADMYFHLLSATTEDKGALAFYTKNDQISFDYFPQPNPTIYAELTIPKKKIKRYFLEIIKDKTPRFALRSLILKYFRYYQEEMWQENTDYSFPKILVVCTNKLTYDYLTRFISRTLEIEDVPLRFFLGLKHFIKENGLQDDTWQRID